MRRDERIDAYIARAEPFGRPILEHLRRLIHEAVPGLEETLKWGMPHFIHNGRNLAGIASFKAHAALVIHPEGSKGEGMGAYGKIRSLADLPADAAIIAALRDAARQLESGFKRPRGAKPAIPMPEDFAAALSADARAFFDRLTPAQRGDYLEWITGAKRPATRARRIAEAASWLAEGKKMNWKYERP